MSKYIIELDDRIKIVTSVGVTENGVVYTTSDYVHNLEELNSDYINEHFSDLQDTAYQKGFEDGKKEAESSEVIEQAKVDAFNKGMLHKGEKIHDAYQRGLHEGNDIGYKDGFEDGKAVNDKGCEGCKYRGTIGMPPCIHCCNNFPNAWKKQDDKPIIGEVVERYLNGKRDGVGMFLGEDGDYWNCLFWTGAIFGTFAYPSNQFKRTGNVCDIEKILEAMKA